MKALLGSLDVLELIEKGFTEPATTQEEENMSEEMKKQLKSSRKKDWKAKSTIYQGLDDSTFEIISGTKTSKEVWETFHKTFKGSEQVKKIRL